MPTPIDTQLYTIAKHKADTLYSKSSAFKSGYIVKTYKELGGRYKADDSDKNLERWYQEKWQNLNIGHNKYPVMRPTVRINSHTPLTVNEIDKKNLKKQIKEKQLIKGNKNLPPFKAKVIK